jgi:hypothetical protein
VIRSESKAACFWISVFWLQDFAGIEGITQSVADVVDTQDGKKIMKPGIMAVQGAANI